MAVGAKLMGFLSAARDIRTDFGRLADFISGESGERACHALATLLTRLMGMQKRVEQTTHTLAGLRHDADKIQRRFSGFDDVVLSFQVVATLGRIETARLGGSQSDLGHFADEVLSCGTKIQTRVGHALQAATALEKRIDSIIKSVSAADIKQLEALPSLLGTVREGLDAFRLRQKEAAASSVSLADEFGSFSDALNSLVAALQFHDITRQRIDHVVESLTQLVSNAATGGRTSRPGPEPTAVIELQRQQLLGAGEAFKASVQRVIQELEQIASRGRAMGEETTALLGPVAEDQPTSFFGEMESCFAGVLAGVAHCAALNEEAALAVAELEHTIASLTGCVHDIRTTTLEINHLALNSTIQAEHLGAVGVPLGVVAGALQTLHVDARERTSETEESLAVLGRAVLSMKQPVAEQDSTAMPSGSAGDIGELRARIDELHLSSGDSVRCRERIRGAAAQLYADVQTASDSFNIGVLVEETLARSCGLLQSIIAESASGTSDADFGLEHLAAQYTMSAERDVHEKATTKSMSEPSPEDSASMATAAIPSDLGENVELF